MTRPDVKRSTIWKFTATHEAPGKVRAPQGARWLSVGCQGYEMVVWAEVDPDAQLIEYAMRFVGAGWDGPLPTYEGFSFIGTVQLPSGIVFHVYVLGEVAR